MKNALFVLLMALALSGCRKSEEFAGGRMAVHFSLQGITAGSLSHAAGAAQALPAAATRAEAENLPAGATVRILAFGRKAGNGSPDPAQDTYEGEAAYLVGSDGSLTPCLVDASGASTGTTGATPLYLRAGTYDFYAITPALPVPDHRQVSVAHGVDYAGSLTPAQAVASASSAPAASVALTMLSRRCALLSFSITRKAANVTKAVIHSVKLSRIAHTPVQAGIDAALPLGANDGSYTFPAAVFVQGPAEYQYAGADEVLPKASAGYDLEMNVTFNDAAEATELKATPPALAFDPGRQYNFDIRLEGGFVVLTLTVMPWKAFSWEVPDVGEPGYVVIEVGRWEISEWQWDTDMGGAFVPVVKPGSWTSNPSWSSEVGGD